MRPLAGTGGYMRKRVRKVITLAAPVPYSKSLGLTVLRRAPLRDRMCARSRHAPSWEAACQQCWDSSPVALRASAGSHPFSKPFFADRGSLACRAEARRRRAKAGGQVGTPVSALESFLECVPRRRCTRAKVDCSRRGGRRNDPARRGDAVISSKRELAVSHYGRR